MPSGLPPPKLFCVTLHIIRADLNPALACLNPIMIAEADQAVLEEFGHCKGWTPVIIFSKLLHLIAVISIMFSSDRSYAMTSATLT